MSTDTIEICTTCNHIVSECLGHDLLASLVGGKNARSRNPDSVGFVGPTVRVERLSKAHREAAAMPLRAFSKWDAKEKAEAEARNRFGGQ